MSASPIVPIVRGGDAEPWQLPIINVTDWIGKTPPDRRFIVDNWLVRGTSGIFVGEDGIGKSLLGQQLATCVATGRKFLGLDVEMAPAIYVSAEDDEDELWRRQRSINAAISVPVDAAPARLSSLVGFIDIDLGAFDTSNRFQSSPTFDAIIARAQEVKTGLIVLDNLAHFFNGNENARRDVAQFSSAMDSMAKETDAAVLMLAHPNKSGAEYSGSTGWSAHVRQRWFIDRPDRETATFDRDARILRKSKANHSESGTEIKFRWHKWAFVRDEDLPEDVAAEARARNLDATDNGIFLACLAERNRQGRAVSERHSRSWAPKVFADMAEAKGVSKERLEKAMDRLFRTGSIERRVVGRDKNKGRDIEGLAEVEGSPKPSPKPLPEPIPGPSANLPQTIPQTCPHTHPPLSEGVGGGLEALPPPLDEDDIDPLEYRRSMQ